MHMMLCVGLIDSFLTVEEPREISGKEINFKNPNITPLLCSLRNPIEVSLKSLYNILCEWHFII